jgi:UDP-N-acetylglucosamine 4,6-dehydratase/5-epimerase
MFSNKTILITGGTGSFGRRFVSHILKNYQPAKVIVFSRDEMKQWEMQKEFSNDARLRFFIGDVRDRDRLYRAFANVNFVVHAAATKIVPTAEYNPFECVKTNILGAMNVIDAAIDRKVESVVALSTDKACAPTNVYGASKLASDKLFVASNHYSAGKNTKFAVVRYGNVIASRGSIIPHLMAIKKGTKVPLTDENMTRFFITLKDAVLTVIHSFSDMVGGEIYVKKIPSMKVIDLIKTVKPGFEIEVVGIRPGEKIHELMIGEEDAQFTYEYEDYFKILPAINNWSSDKKRIKTGKPVDKSFSYNSENNLHWLSSDELLKAVRETKNGI